MRVTGRNWSFIVGVALTLTGCKWPTFMSAGFSALEREGNVVVDWLDKGGIDKPSLLLPVKKATVRTVGNRLRLNLKSAGDVSYWTYAQLIEVDFNRGTDTIEGFASQAGSYRFHYIGRDGLPKVAVYHIVVEKSAVMGTVGGSVELKLYLTKSRKTADDGKRYSPELPTDLLFSTKVDPKWK